MARSLATKDYFHRVGAVWYCFVWVRKNKTINNNYQCGCSVFFHLSLLLGGDIEVNPGEGKFPCGICSEPVKSNQLGIQWDKSKQWVLCEAWLLQFIAWGLVTRSQQAHPAPGFALSANCQIFQSYSLKIHWIHNVIVVGNFNALNISWDNLKVSANLSFPSKKSTELTHEYNLAQFIKEPTRQQGNLSNTMDLVSFNHPDIICNFSCIIRNQQSWYIVLFTLKPSCQKKWYDKPKVYIRKWWAY